MKIYSSEELYKIKDAAKTILDVVKTCPGSSTHIMINDILVSGDIGYVLEFLEDAIENLICLTVVEIEYTECPKCGATLAQEEICSCDIKEKPISATIAPYRNL